MVLLVPMHAGAPAEPQLTADRDNDLATLRGAILFGGVLQGLGPPSLAVERSRSPVWASWGSGPCPSPSRPSGTTPSLSGGT